jgi:hypothetical protein
LFFLSVKFELGQYFPCFQQANLHLLHLLEIQLQQAKTLHPHCAKISEGPNVCRVQNMYFSWLLASPKQRYLQS